MRRPLYACVVGIPALILLAGCVHDGDWTLQNSLGWEKVRTPTPPKFADDSLKIAQRVDELGQWIILQNSFCGLEPHFYTLNVREPILFHRGTNDVFISSGLVGQCKTEVALAAALCSELGQMKAELSAAERVGRGAQPETAPADGKPAPPIDAHMLTCRFMSDSGFDPGELDRMQARIVESNRNAENMRKLMAGSAPAPTWER